MKKLGFDNEKYIKLQSENIRERINAFGGRLYLESRRGSRFELDSVQPLCAGKYISAWQILKESQTTKRSEEA